MSSDRVVITGLGAVSCLGLTTEQMWSGLCRGESGIDKITAFDPSGFSCQLAGEVEPFKIRDYVPKNLRKSTKVMSRDIELSIVAANEAISDSGLLTKANQDGSFKIDPTRFSINFGAGLISCDLEELSPAVAASISNGEFDIQKWGTEGLRLVTPLWLLKYLPNMLACHIGIIHDIQGPSNTITCAEASAHLAISESVGTILRGASDIALTGAAEAKVNPIVMIRQCLIKRATEKYNDDPQSACRPFDSHASGAVFGEGAGMLVLERLELAIKRGAKIYAEIVGIGESNTIDSSYEHLEGDGIGVQIAIEKALEDAGIEAGDLDLLIPHGMGIAEDDIIESKAIEAALGSAVKDVPVWPTKSMLSCTGAASGALDVIAGICAIKDSQIPAAKNIDEIAEGCSLNIVTEKIEKPINYVLCCSYTYGGQTAAVVLKKYDSEASV